MPVPTFKLMSSTYSHNSKIEIIQYIQKNNFVQEFNVISYAIGYNRQMENFTANKHKKEHFKNLKSNEKIDQVLLHLSHDQLLVREATY